MIDRCISVSGLGYTGLPLLVALADQVRAVIGLEVDAVRVQELQAGVDRSGSVDAERLAGLGPCLTLDSSRLVEADFHIIAVPTPVDQACEPDLGALFAATARVGAQLRPGARVVYESTVYPGLTEEECIPRLEQASGLCCGRDFVVGYSPERVNPGDALHSLEQTVKIIACPDDAVLEEMAELYGTVVQAGLHRVSRIRVAEAAKVIENTQRDINIALMNEFAMLFEQLGLDTADVLAAAGSKWNFMRYTPGLVGGHCIGVDPYYLTCKARSVGYEPRLILAGRDINDAMGAHIAHRVMRELLRSGRPLVVTVLGVSFKADVPDVRNSRTVDLIAGLRDSGAQVQVHDPVADAVALRADHGVEVVAVEALQPASAVVLAVPHRQFVEASWGLIRALLHEQGGMVFDVKSVLPRERLPAGVSLLRL